MLSLTQLHAVLHAPKFCQELWRVVTFKLRLPTMPTLSNKLCRQWKQLCGNGFGRNADDADAIFLLFLLQRILYIHFHLSSKLLEITVGTVGKCWKRKPGLALDCRQSFILLSALRRHCRHVVSRRVYSKRLLLLARQASRRFFLWRDFFRRRFFWARFIRRFVRRFVRVPCHGGQKNHRVPLHSIIPRPRRQNPPPAPASLPPPPPRCPGRLGSRR